MTSDSISSNKHIIIQWHFVRDKVKTGAVRFEWISTNDMVVARLPYLVPTTSSSAFHTPSNMKASELMSIKYNICWTIATAHEKNHRILQ